MESLIEDVHRRMPEACEAIVGDNLEVANLVSGSF